MYTIQYVNHVNTTIFILTVEALQQETTMDSKFNKYGNFAIRHKGFTANFDSIGILKAALFTVETR